MTATEYLEIKLNQLHTKFPHISIRYGVDTDIDAHLIELLPIDEYNTNRALDKAWMPIAFEFRQIFPDLDISFFSSDSLLSVDSPIFEKLPVYKSEKEILSSLFENVTGYSDLPKGNVSGNKKVDWAIVNPVITPELNLNVENINEYSYPLAA